jgi:endo-1,4-beta-xylanase
MKHSNWTRRDLICGSLAAAAATAIPGWARAFDSKDFHIDVTGPASLRAHAQARGLLFGMAVDQTHLDLDGFAAGNTTDPYTLLAATQANIVVAENCMKWGPLRPTADSFDFTQADRFMRFAALAGQRVRGHNLCWHEQLPAWFNSTATKDNAAKLLTDHIKAVAGRYRGQVHSWDVVNEAVEIKDGRPDALRNSPWLGLLGPDYIELAFKCAAEADPGARLTYNEYGIELDNPDDSAKRGQVLLLLRRLKARNIPIHAAGIQSHLNAGLQPAGAGLRSFIREVKALGLEVYITELDVNTHLLEGGPEARDTAVAEAYRDFLGLVLPEPNVTAALLWGISDAYTWLNAIKADWTKRKDGTPQRPLPFDDKFNPTPAFVAVRTAIDRSRSVSQAAAPAIPPDRDPNYLYKTFRVGDSAPSQPATAQSSAMQHRN